MPGWTMVNGVWREMWGSRSKTDGVIRDNNIYTRVDGVIRVIRERSVDVTDILGFVLVYHPVPSKTHPQFPNLTYNPNIPVAINITSGSNQMDMSEKGAILRYDAKDYDQEGIIMYEGRIFIELNNGTLIDMMNCKPDPGTDQCIDTGIPGLGDAWITNAITDLTVTIETRMSYESFGFFTSGWNSMFTDEQTVPDFYFDNSQQEHAHIDRSHSLILSPSDCRGENFKPVAEIGIARDTRSAETHMVGSHGFLSQTIEKIWVDGELKPFMVSKYD